MMAELEVSECECIAACDSRPNCHSFVRKDDRFCILYSACHTVMANESTIYVMEKPHYHGANETNFTVPVRPPCATTTAAPTTTTTTKSNETLRMEALQAQLAGSINASIPTNGSTAERKAYVDNIFATVTSIAASSAGPVDDALKKEATTLAVGALTNAATVLEPDTASLKTLGDSVKAVIKSSGGVASREDLSKASAVVETVLDNAVSQVGTIADSAGKAMLGGIVSIADGLDGSGSASETASSKGAVAKKVWTARALRVRQHPARERWPRRSWSSSRNSHSLWTSTTPRWEARRS
eukprot:gnl/TRDRNA2_/TRDRNA2_81719_c0_seq1.p1 gnl/TRDRNA2_/TRDRNA2_81719_c0~~gnl/TRDRNA2_/TRDRNA2_81719_c0_seq1.p1  ORF type:complete len:344 (+),score=45.24 gnl/TRDRNA2_/TRDRNA2_81719_c0_seq1:141-1034(+)